MRAILNDVHVVLAHEQPDVADELTAAMDVGEAVDALTAAVTPRRSNSRAMSRSAGPNAPAFEPRDWSQ